MGNDERGAAATIVLFPIFAAVTFMFVQGAFWQNDRQLVAAVADRASAAVALFGSSPGDAETVVRAQLASAGIDDVAVSISRGTEATTVTVTGRAPGLLAGMSVAVSARSVTPTEGYRPP